tara:strand:+ start:470 stop:1702 length:1233 start_codon:yes stop_codon:yes gene_type:complete
MNNLGIRDLTLYLIGISIFFQPLNIKIQGLSISVLLIIFFILVSITIKKTYYLDEIFLFFPPIICLIYFNLINSLTDRGFIVSIYLTFIFFIFKSKFKESTINNLWKITFLVSLFLVMIGFYRFIFGYNVPYSENAYGYLYRSSRATYLGIDYGIATRNSDALYFGVFFISSLRFYLKSKLPLEKLIFSFLSILGFFSSLLNLSRAYIFACLLTIYIAFKNSKRFNIINFFKILFFVSTGFGIVFLLSFILPGSNYFLGLTFNAILSIFNPNNLSIDGQQLIYSNQERISLYINSIFDFIKFPFGRGIDFSINYIENKLNSENLYFDLLISTGIFSIPLIINFIKKLFYIIKRINISLEYRLIGMESVFLFILTLTNHYIDLAIFWYFLALVLIDFNKIKENTDSLKYLN